MRVELIQEVITTLTVSQLVSSHKGEYFVGYASREVDTILYVTRSGVVALDDSNYSIGGFWPLSNPTVFTVKRFCEVLVKEL